MQKRQSFMKAFTYRASATGLTMLLAYAFTQDIMVALMMAPADFILKLLLYYFHERIWNRIEWGKNDD